LRANVDRESKVRKYSTVWVMSAALLSVGLAGGGCGSTAAFFNPAFINSTVGGYVPVTPGPLAAFVLVRCVNDTGQQAEFIVTIQRDVPVLDDQGNYQIDEDGEYITRSVRQTVRLTTAAVGTASELGVLFPCGESPVTHIGLGENLEPTDAAVYVGGEGTGGAAGYGVAAGDLNPLQLETESGIPNFVCGDTVIFQAFLSTGSAGGIALQSFLLPGSEQPDSFRGPSTFANLEQYLESRVGDLRP